MKRKIKALEADRLLYKNTKEGKKIERTYKLMQQIERKRIQGNIGSRMKSLQKIFFLNQNTKRKYKRIKCCWDSKIVPLPHQKKERRDNSEKK